MPVVRINLKNRPEKSAETQNVETELPEILRTPSGTVMLEIQGVINVGETPLLRTELDLGPQEADPQQRNIFLGRIDLSQVTEAGSPVTLEMGKSQLLRGKVVKLGVPLAIMEVSAAEDEVEGQAEVPVLEIITHKAVFSSRPEPIMGKSM